MAERLDDRDLERTLSDIGTRLGGPKRDLWPAVRTRIAERRARPWWSRLSIERGMLAPVAATLAVILVAALLLTPRVADALGNLLNLTGVQIYRVPQTPTGRPTAPALSFAGQRVATAAEASRIAGFTVRTPAALGDPSAIYVETAPVRVTIVYASVKGIPAPAMLIVGEVATEHLPRRHGNLLSKILSEARDPYHLERFPIHPSQG